MRHVMSVILLLAGASAASAQGTWSFQPGQDRFSEAALLDLRWMNEAIAGQSGFVRLSDDGESFVRGDGQPIRFWAVGTSVQDRHPQRLAEHARFLAKRGVNMVRWHGRIESKDADADIHRIDEKALDQLFRLVAAMKREGIYVTISPYYAHQSGKRFVGHGVMQNTQAGNPTGLLFFHPTMQAAYKAWLRELFTRPNPYTGIALKDEPAVAIFQIQNEDSLLFWTFNSIGGEDLDLLRKQFGAWLARKYGSLGRARAAWDDAPPRGSKVPDDWDRGLVSFPNLWHLTQDEPAGSGFDRRMADALAFLTETMRNWNAEVARYLREDIGAPHIINAGNWKTADEARLGDAERYSYTANEVIGLNRYVGGIHEGRHNGWAVVKGDRFTEQSVLTQPQRLPVAVRQPAGHPFIIPESLWVPPTPYQAEGPLLVAAYQSLGGVDAFCWFNFSQPQWRQPSSANGYLDSVGKWVADTPEILGNFPAAALIFRQGYLKEGEPVAIEHRPPKVLWSRRPPAIVEGASFDPNRDQDDRVRGDVRDDSALAFLVGPVKVAFTEGEDRIADLAPYIDRDRGIVRSNTGELAWNYRDGWCTINAPRAQGATGFLSRAGSIDLADVTIDCANAYASIVVVSMDGQPIATSQHLLVQAGTIARPTGWQTRDVTWTRDKQTIRGKEIVAHGKAPWQIVRTQATVTLRTAAVRRATAVDPNGMAVEPVRLRRIGDGGLQLQMPPDAKYVVLQP